MESLWIQVAMGALKSFSFVYDVMTFPIYLLLQRPWKRRVMSRRIKVNFDNKHYFKCFIY
jgi:long-chain acyl-CoA synthetase